VTDADGTLLVTLRHDPATDGHVVERHEGGRVA
jgi:hypothetical protein